jgi:hypothetical protein|tara:strand:+ start:39 stop:317 length:279 start_codon:yes stop_codon:yes gene_type:complete
MLGRIYDLMKRDLTVHQKSVNIWLLTNKREDFPKLPPQICPCEITLKSGSRYKAYLDQQHNEDWIEYGNTWAIRKNGRKSWNIKDVIKWELI